MESKPSGPIVVSVVGDAGVGKSTLVETLATPESKIKSALEMRSTEVFVEVARAGLDGLAAPERASIRFLELSPNKESGRNESRNLYYQWSHMILLCLNAALDEKALRNLEVAYLPEIAHLVSSKNRPIPILVLLMKADLLNTKIPIESFREILDAILYGPNAVGGGKLNMVDIIPCSGISGLGIDRIRNLLMTTGFDFYKEFREKDETEMEQKRRQEEDRRLEAEKNREETQSDADKVVNNCVLC